MKPPGRPDDGPGNPEPDRLAARTATTLARVLLLLYPPSVRADVGNALVGDVGRRARELASSQMGVRVGFWLVRLTTSLLANAFAAWRDELIPDWRLTPGRPRRSLVSSFRMHGSRGAIAMSQPKPRFFRFAAAGACWLDVKLATRMLFKHPGLTLVAIFTLAIGIPVGLLPLHVLDSLTTPLPVEDGEEIVIVRNYDRTTSDPVMRPLHDFVQWRKELSSFEDLGMWRTELYNVNSEDGRAAPVRGAEVTASVFSLLRIPPLFGRPLNEADEVMGAPDVVVIGYDLWQSRMAGDRDIVGSTIRIGAIPYTVVGVMPEGFLFPIRDHLWLPFRYDPLEFERGSGPAGSIMGRLADGVSIEEARNEIELLGQRMARQFPDTHAQLQPQVLPYTHVLTEMDSPEALASGSGRGTAP